MVQISRPNLRAWMMRVLWVFGTLSPQMVGLATLVESQSDIELRIISGTPLPAEISRLAGPRVSCRNKIDFRAQQQIREYLKSEPCDVAHAYSGRNMANLAGACWGLRQTPQLIGYRGIVDRLSRLDVGTWLTFWNRRFDRIHCVCRATQAALADSGIPAAKLATVWEGCNPQLLIARPRELLAEFGIPADAFVIGTVANARPVKGIDIMLRSAIELSSEIEIYWLVVGSIIDPQVARLARDPRLKGRAKLIGPQVSGGGFCGLMDIYVAPSRKEGLSMGIMEAMSQGVCPIVSNVGGNPELIRHEVDGIVIPAEDPQALSQAVRELWLNPDTRARYADSAQRRASEVFSIEAWGARLINSYRELVGQSARNANKRVA